MSALLQQMKQDSPLAVWPMDESSGVTLNDRSGSNRHLTLTGTFALAQSMGPFRGVDFDGVSGYAFRADEAWQTLAGDHTLEAWVVLDAAPSAAEVIAGIVTKDRNGGDAGSNIPYGIDVRDTGTGGNFRAFTSSIASFSLAEGTTASVVGRLYHLVQTRTAADLRLWVNQINETTIAAPVSPWDSTRKLVIARNRTDLANRFFNGKVAYVALYDSALSADRIKAHYAAGIRGGVVVG